MLISRCLTLAAGLRKWEETWLTDIIILTVLVRLFGVLHITSHHEVYEDREGLSLGQKMSFLLNTPVGVCVVMVVGQVHIRTP